MVLDNLGTPFTHLAKARWDTSPHAYATLVNFSGRSAD